jgi:ABC-type sulfate transport system substrate-binding protein
LILSRTPLARLLRRWMPVVFWGLLCLYAFWPWLHGPAPSHRTIVFYGYSTLGEVMTQSIFPAFQKEWGNATGERVEFASSFSGSGTATNQLIMGVPAQIALLSLEPDAQRLAEKGVISSGSWRNLPYGGVLNRTSFIILVRQGNPKNIHDFSDLARPGIKVVHPDPLTSGAGIRRHPGQPGAGYDLLLGIWRNVVAQAHSARAARTQFENGFGDALITYEQEALWDLAHGTLRAEIIYPSSTIMSEQILVMIGRNIRHHDRELVSRFLRFLWSDRAQLLFVNAGFRSVDERLNSLNPLFRRDSDLFSVADLGGWTDAKSRIVNGIWKDKVLKELGPQQP